MTPSNAKGDAVEAKAQELYYAYAGPGAQWKCVDPHYQETVWRAEARAAIEAMRAAHVTAQEGAALANTPAQQEGVSALAAGDVREGGQA